MGCVEGYFAARFLTRVFRGAGLESESACRGNEGSARFPVFQNLRATAGLAVLLVCSCPWSRADIPVPVRLTEPADAGEAWNVIRLAMGNARSLFDENRVDETKEQVALIGPSLRVLAREGALEGRQTEAGSLAEAAFEKVNLLVRESMVGNLEGARTIFEALDKDFEKLSLLFPPDLPSTEIYSCVDHPEIARVGAGNRCPDCGKTLRPRRFPYSVVFTRVDSPTLHLDLKSDKSPQAGQETRLTFRLSDKNGEPVGSDDLVVSHSSRIHLLLVDEKGGDFQHAIPESGNEPGTFATTFHPASSAGYRAWVVAVPAATRLTEYLPWTIPGSTAAVSDELRAPEFGAFSASDEGISVHLLAGGSGPLRIEAGRTNLVRIHVSGAGGEPLRDLEPLWNAFAHLTLVAWDFHAAHQVHSVGGEILSPDLRGGPEFSFKLHPPKPGWWRLYLQLRIEGRIRTFPLWFEAVD